MVRVKGLGLKEVAIPNKKCMLRGMIQLLDKKVYYYILLLFKKDLCRLALSSLMPGGRRSRTAGVATGGGKICGGSLRQQELKNLATTVVHLFPFFLWGSPY